MNQNFKIKKAFFKANAKNTGAALIIDTNVNSKDSTRIDTYLKIVRQVSWDDKNKTGTFKDNMEKPGQFANISLSVDEMSSIIYAIDSKTKFSAYHAYNDKATTLNLIKKEYTDKDGVTSDYFILNINQDPKNKDAAISISLSMGEMQTIRVIAEEVVRNSLYAGSQKANSDSSGTGEQTRQSTTAKAPAPVPAAAAVTVGTEEDDDLPF